MDAGIYTSAIGMMDQFNVENSIADNLANLQTPGYKERSAVIQDFSSVLYNNQQDTGSGVGSVDSPIGRLALPPTIRDFGLNLAQGSARHTGSPRDLMIAGNAFFRVRSGNQILLTRDGSFQRSARGLLTTREGYPVLDAAGKPIQLPQGQFETSRTGELLANNKPIARIALASVPVGTPLKEVTGGYYSGPGTLLPARPQGVAVLQGYLETSNVDMATQTSNMIAAQRAYQADAKMLQIQDDTFGLTVNELGKVSG